MDTLKRVWKCFHAEIDIPPLIQIAGTYLDLSSIPTWFVALRCTVCVLMWYITIMSLALYADYGVFRWWFIYLTNWNQTLCTVVATIRCGSTISIYRSFKDSKDGLTKELKDISPGYRRLFKVQTVLTEMAIPLMTLVWIHSIIPIRLHFIHQHLNVYIIHLFFAQYV